MCVCVYACVCVCVCACLCVCVFVCLCVCVFFQSVADVLERARTEDKPDELHLKDSLQHRSEAKKSQENFTPESEENRGLEIAVGVNVRFGGCCGLRINEREIL